MIKYLNTLKQLLRESFQTLNERLCEFGPVLVQYENFVSQGNIMRVILCCVLQDTRAERSRRALSTLGQPPEGRDLSL